MVVYIRNMDKRIAYTGTIAFLKLVRSIVQSIVFIEPQSIGAHPHKPLLILRKSGDSPLSGYAVYGLKTVFRKLLLLSKNLNDR